MRLPTKDIKIEYSSDKMHFGNIIYTGIAPVYNMKEVHFLCQKKF